MAIIAKNSINKIPENDIELFTVSLSVANLYLKPVIKKLVAKIGGARRDRTDDLLHAMQALFQLSYGPKTGD
jgi:hypothetical protein